MADGFDLARFVDAQAESYATALGEIGRGAKRSHWMWFVFPQLAGLGRSAMAMRYAIGGVDEARAYLAHPLLGARLVEACAAVVSASGTAAAIMGEVDALKLRSSLTLFARASGEAPFADALDRWFGGEDAATVGLLDRQA